MRVGTVRFVFRHFTAILIAIVLAWWAVFYLPKSPTWAIFWLRNAVENRQGDQAIKYVDFQSVVQHAAKEMVEQNAGGDPLGAFVGQAAAQLLSQPMAGLAQAWARRKVDEGDPHLRIPFPALLGSIFMLHRSGDTAWTRFTDHKGQTWDIRMTREEGRWQITEVKNVRQLLEKLENHEAKEFNAAP